jgi:hypothetical protein
MRLWLWDVANYCGVSDDEACALKHAEERMQDGDAARVELAFLAASFEHLTNNHIRTSAGWTATQESGSVTWAPLSSAPQFTPSDPKK